MSRLTLFLGLYIIISASFMFQVFKFAQTHIGRRGMMILMGLTLASSALGFLIYTVTASIKRKRFNLPRTLVVVIVLIMILVLSWQIKNFAERFHIIEFVILGWLATRDLAKTETKIKSAILASIFCAAVGILDELFQWILPYRFFDLNDIISNTLGGGWGAVLYLITGEQFF